LYSVRERNQNLDFTDFLPSELAAMEKLVQARGIVQTTPAVPDSAMKKK